MAYLGKISAVLTANTADFTRNIGTARQELNSFAASARNIQVRLDTRSLDDTLTRLQRFSRTVQEIQRLQAQGVDAGLPNPTILRNQFRAYEDIGRALTRVKDGIESLSTASQAGLYPALERVQVGFRNLYASISSGTTTYTEQRAEVERLRESLTRLSRQQASSAAIGSAARALDIDSTGASFTQPRALEALKQALALRSQAEQVPANLRGSVFNALAEDAQRSANAIEAQAARVARAQLDLAEGAGSQGAVDASQRRLDSLVQGLRTVNAQFETELRSTKIQSIVRPQANAEITNLVNSFETLSSQLRAIDGTRFNGLIAAVGALVEGFNRATVSATQAAAAVEALEAQRGASLLTTRSISSGESAVATDLELGSREIARANNLALQANQGFRSQLTQQATDLRSRIAAISGDELTIPIVIGGLDAVNREIAIVTARIKEISNIPIELDVDVVGGRAELDGLLGRAQQLDEQRVEIEVDLRRLQAASAEAAKLREELATVNAQLDAATRDRSLIEARSAAQLAAQGFASGLAPRLGGLRESAGRISGLVGEDLRVEGSVLGGRTLDAAQLLRQASEATDPGNSARLLEQYRNQIASLTTDIAAYEGRVRVAATTQEQFNEFLRVAGGLGTKIDPQVASAGIAARSARQIVGNYPDDLEGRASALEAIEGYENRIQGLIAERAKIAAGVDLVEKDGLTVEQQKAALLQSNNAQLKEATQELIKQIALSSGGTFSEERVSTIISRAQKNAGSISAFGANSATLAFQQGLFAIDDFFSATGGLEYKLRAVGNNVTQLGLLLGQSGVIPWLSATKGLAIGLGAVLGTQLALALYRFANSGVEAADRTKALTSALQEQKGAAEQLAKAFEQLNKASTLEAFAGPARSGEEFRRQIEGFRRDQTQIARDRAAGLDSTVIRERAFQASRERKIQQATNAGDIVSLQREIELSRLRERAAIDAALAAPTPQPGGVLEILARQRGERVERSSVDMAGGLEAARLGEEARKAYLDFLNANRLPELNANPALLEGDVRNEIDSLIKSKNSLNSDLINRQIEELQRILELLRRGAILRLQQEFIDFAVTLRAAQQDIAQANRAVEDAIRQGIPGAVNVANGLRDIADSLTKAEEDFSKANVRLERAESMPQSTPAEKEARDKEIEAARQEREAARQRGDQARANAAGQARAADATRFNLQVDPLRNIDSRLRRTSSILDSPEIAFRTDLQRRQRVIEATRDQIQVDRDRLAADTTLTPEARRAATAAIETRNQEVSKAAAALESLASSARAAAESLSRLGQSIEASANRDRDLVQQAQERVNSRSRNFQEEPLRGEEERVRNQALARAQQSEREVAAARARLQSEQLSFLNTPEGQAAQDVVQQAQSKREAAQLEFDKSGTASAYLDLQEAIQEEEAARRALADIVNNATVVQQRELEQALRFARERQQATALDLRQREFQAPIGDAVRGFERSLRPAQRAQEELARAFADLNALSQAERDLGRPVAPAEELERRRRAFGDIARQSAPMVFQFADEVRNATLQGPSRAAIRAADATTVEGQTELNRLNRGDDPNQNVDIIELRKQTDILQKLLDRARELGVNVAN